MNKNSLSSVVLAMLLLLTGVAVAHADELNDLKQRFRQRYPQLLALRQEGKIGETWQGFIELVEAPVDEVQAKLLKDENVDRTRLYQLLAEEENTTSQVVAQRNALRNFQRAVAGEFLKGRDGKWHQKGQEE